MDQFTLYPVDQWYSSYLTPVGTAGDGDPCYVFVYTAVVTITSPAHQVIKTLLSPDPGPANYGDLVTFRIVVTNTGDTAIESLPLEDAYISDQ